MLAYSSPTMAATIPHWLNLRLDQLIVIALLDARALGLYVVAVAWSGAAHPLAAVVAHNAVPALAGAKDTWQRARLVYRAGAVAAIGTSVLLLAATPTLLPLIFGVEFRAAIPVALVMVLAGAVEATNAVGAECLRGVGRPRAVSARRVRRPRGHRRRPSGSGAAGRHHRRRVRLAPELLGDSRRAAAV